MKNAGLLLLSISLLALRCAGQTNVDACLSPEQARFIASQLSVGMAEEKAHDYLCSKGFRAPICVGDSFRYSRVYFLTNNCTLSLHIVPKQFRADGAWVNGIVQRAWIQSHGTNTPIRLRGERSLLGTQRRIDSMR